LRQHSIDHRIAGAGKKNEQWKFDRGVERLQWRAPDSERETIKA
jgi:hypothetical protein